MVRRYEILCGDALECLKTLPSGSVQCCVTSPPYFGLRSYTADPAEIGKESTIAAYVANLVAVFREVKRVLRDDGTLWVNLGDSYASDTKGGVSNGSSSTLGPKRDGLPGNKAWSVPHGCKNIPKELPPKSLLGIPWRVAFALQDDGWILRSDIIWAKPAPMPESVTDRCTKSHEYVFMLAKQQKYFYDAEAIKENGKNWGSRDRSNMRNGSTDGLLKHHGLQNCDFAEAGRNKRDVWTVNTEPSSYDHYALMPSALVEPCILSGTSERGACASCGAPWVRVVEKQGQTARQKQAERGKSAYADSQPHTAQGLDYAGGHGDNTRPTVTLGFSPTCHCNADTAPCVVLDPFAGMCTTLVVALKLGRRGIGIELNPKYAELSEKRLRDVPQTLAGLI